MNRKRTKGDMSSWYRIVDTDGSTVGYAPDHVTAQTHAAAPELLEACKLLVEEVRADLLEAGGCDHSVGICMCETIHRVEQAEAAIAKAEGRGDGPQL